MRRLCIRVLPGPGFQAPRNRLPETFHGTHVVAGDHHDPHRDHQSSRPLAFTYRAPLCQHVCRRHGDHGVFLPHTDRSPRSFPGAPLGSFAAADVYFYPADHGLSLGSRGRGTLNSASPVSSFRFRFFDWKPETGNWKTAVQREGVVHTRMTPTTHWRQLIV